MIQAIGLTSAPRRSAPPAVDDLTFDARAGHVTALLGTPGAGKTTALRLMLHLQPGRGTALFRGRPLDHIPHPTREVGVLLGDVPGHPGRTVGGHVRMLAAAAGVPAERADEVLDRVGLSGIAYQRLGALSLGMDRRLGLAAALIGDPHTLVLDEPAWGLSPREATWLHGLLREFAVGGGVVLITLRDPREAARVADRVVTLQRGRLAADQDAAEFARTRLRPRVAVRSPQATRLAALLADDSCPGGPSEVVRESGNRILVYGSTCAAVGEVAFRHGILVHQLADETGDSGPESPPLDRADGRLQTKQATPPPASQATPTPSGTPVPSGTSAPSVAPALSGTSAPPATPALSGATVCRDSAPQAAGRQPAPAAANSATVTTAATATAEIRPVAPTGPVWPLRYELHRAGGVRTGWLAAAGTLAVSLLCALLMARAGETSAARLISGWPVELPLPPAAFTAGLLGALAFGQEFRYPALTHADRPVPRWLGLVVAKLGVCTAAAVALAALSAIVNSAALWLFFGGEALNPPSDWPVLAGGWAGLVIGCTWAGLLAAGLFRSTTMGLAAVLAVPVLVVPAVQALPVRPATYPLAGLPGRLREASLVRWPSGGDHWITDAVRLGTQPVGQALVLALCALLCAYLTRVLRGRSDWWPPVRRVQRELPTTQRR
ncbi:ATP-binding cassette domain-containing protein [Streptomyces pathocidini]|uniref:ABC transporter ATP-binding protein n=1 Tax=Streptomyces pathocidini TaxID=1650571 RepID=UPI0034042D7E